MSFNMGKSESSSQQSAQNSSSSRQDVWGGQVPFLQGLYQQGSEMLRGIQGQPGPQYQQPAFEAWSRMLQGGGQNPALGGAIQEAQRRAGEGFQENILPALTSSAIGSGNLGGARGQIAAGIAGRDAMREQSNIATSMTANDYGQQQQRILQALGQAGGLSGLSASSFAPLLAYAQLLGRPTVLGTSESQGTSQGSGSSESWNFGIGATR